MTEDFAGYRTYIEWTDFNRIVRRGEKAQFFRVNDDKTEGIAVFSEDQTEHYDAGEHIQWSTYVSAEEWRNRRKSNPTIRIDHDPNLGVTVWCGNDKYAIEVLKNKGYTYHPGTHRWSNKDKTVEQVVAGWQNSKKHKYTVINDAR